jgi:hypothetical protein
MGRPYPPGTTLVLKNDNGGRLFTVFEDRGEEGIVELAMMSSQQQYRDPIPRHRLVNPGSAEKAHEMIGQLKRMVEIRDEALRREKAVSEKTFRSIYLQYETEADLEDAH